MVSLYTGDFFLNTVAKQHFRVIFRVETDFVNFPRKVMSLTFCNPQALTVPLGANGLSLGDT
jgi:hypothetical protein